MEIRVLCGYKTRTCWTGTTTLVVKCQHWCIIYSDASCFRHPVPSSIETVAPEKRKTQYTNLWDTGDSKYNSIDEFDTDKMMDICTEMNWPIDRLID